MGDAVAYIYKIENKVNGKVYIGSTKNFKNRVGSHKYNLRKQLHSNKHLQNAWNKYGEDSFEFSIVEITTESDKLNREQINFEKFDVFNNGYNIVRSAKWGHMEYESISGENHTLSVHDNDQIYKAKKFMAENVEWEVIKEALDVGSDVLNNILNGQCWLSVGAEFNEDILKQRLERNIRMEIKKENRKHVHRMRNKGMTFSEISEILGIASETARRDFKKQELELRGRVKHCVICNKKIYITSRYNSKAKYCDSCKEDVKKEQSRQSARRRRGGGDEKEILPIYMFDEDGDFIRSFDDHIYCAKYLKKLKLTSTSSVSSLSTKIKKLAEKEGQWKQFRFSNILEDGIYETIE